MPTNTLSAKEEKIQTLAREGRQRIAILGHVGTQNLGDEAILAAVIQNLRVRLPDVEIDCFTARPEDTELRHGIRAFPVRRPATKAYGPNASLCSPDAAHSASGTWARLADRIRARPQLYRSLKSIQAAGAALVRAACEPAFLIQSYRNLKRNRLLIIAGSQQLNDAYGGPWGFPYTLFKWTLLAKLAGTRVGFLSVGAGPLTSSLSRWFCRCALSWADYRSYRDDISSLLAQRLGVRGENPVVPDLVYSLSMADTHSSRPSARPVVGINPVPFFDGRYWPTEDRRIYEDYVRKIANFAKWLVDTGHQVVLFPTQLRADPLVIDDIRQALNGYSSQDSIRISSAFRDVEGLIQQLCEMDLVVANRYHGILLSITLNKPVLGLAYHDKSTALLTQIGVGEYAMDVKELDLSQMQARFALLESQAKSVKQVMLDKIGKLRGALDRQYDQVLALLDRG
jgi:polysaccharide pyruvyl transferase WcaK-like protein